MICKGIQIFRIPFITVILLHLIVIQSCSNNKIHTIYTSEKTKLSENVEIEQLLNNPEAYKGKIIETIGLYYTGFEESAIYINNGGVRRKESKQALWITFNNEYYPLIDSKTGVNLLSSYQTIEKINGKKIKVKGKFNPTSKGHLSMFFGSIENVFYVEVMN